MSITYTRYIVPCITEGIGVDSGFVSSVPTVCPNNNTHTIDPTGIRVVDTIVDKVVVIKQSTNVTVGPNFRVDCYTVNIPANATVTYDISYPYNICTYLVTYQATPENIGDSFDVIGAPDTICARLAADIEPGVTTLTLNPVYVTLYPGYSLTITNGTDTDNLGEIKTYNIGTGVITFTNATTHSFVATNIVRMSVYRVKCFNIVNGESFVIGRTKIDASGLPANVKVRFVYRNKSNVDKTFNFFMEIGY